MTTPLELVVRLGHSFTDLTTGIKLLKQIEHKYQRIRFLIDIDEANPRTIIPFLKLSGCTTLQKTTSCIHGRPSNIVKIPEINSLEGFYIFAKVLDVSDIEALKQIKLPVEAVAFWVKNGDISVTLSAYQKLKESSIEVKDFVTIKLRYDDQPLTNEGLKQLKDFSASLKDDYFYNKERDEVFNYGTPYAIKGIRSIRKFLLKFSYAEIGTSLECRDGQFFNAVSNKPISQEEISNLEVFDEEKILPIGFACENCQSCPLDSECSKYSDDIRPLPYSGFCNEAKFYYALFSGIAEIPEDENRRKAFEGKKPRLA